MVQVGIESENLWRPAKLDASRLDRSPIPGTSVIIPLMAGIPSTILKAFAADLNAYVESVMNSRGGTDEGGWTPTNSVATSNHLNGTAFDYNWSDHPMGPPAEQAGWNSIEIQTLRELLTFYTWNGVRMVWWAADWNSPKDSMHFQMGYDTYGKQDVCRDFIANRIRSDGFSTFRRGEDQGHGGKKLVVPAGGGTFWTDVSRWQGKPVDASYKDKVFSFRTNAGDEVDTLAAQNAKAAKALLDSGQLSIVIPYYFFRPGQANCDLHKEILEAAGLFNHPRTVTMVDVEGDNGTVKGDNSWEINDEVNRIRGWYQNQRRVIGYYNSNADPSLWRTRGGIDLVVPQYYRTPGDISTISDPQVRTDAIAHQFTDRQTDVPPWAGQNVDRNWSPYSVEELLVWFGMKEGVKVPSQEQMIRELYDRIIGIPWYEDHQWPSLAWFRDDNKGSGDTVQKIRQADGSGWDTAVTLGALGGAPEQVARVHRLAAGEGPGAKLEDGTENTEAINYAKAIARLISTEDEA